MCRCSRRVSWTLQIVWPCLSKGWGSTPKAEAWYAVAWTNWPATTTPMSPMTMAAVNTNPASVARTNRHATTVEMPPSTMGHARIQNLHASTAKATACQTKMGTGCATASNSLDVRILRHATTTRFTLTTQATATTLKSTTTVKATVCRTAMEMEHAMSSKFWAARMRNSATTTLKRQKTTEAVGRTIRPTTTARVR